MVDMAPSLLTWALRTKTRMLTARNESIKHAAPMKPVSPLVIGSDCSGLGVESFALKALGVPHVCAWVSDKCPAARKFLKKHCGPQQVFSDMQSIKALPPKVVLYLCGFPCQPWSRLHSQSKLWNDARAAVFRKTVDRIKTLRPPLTVLENVLGFVDQWKKVMKIFAQQLSGFQVVAVMFCSSQIGSSGRRPRVWIIILRDDVVATASVKDLVEAVKNMMAAAQQGQPQPDLKTLLQTTPASVNMDITTAFKVRKSNMAKNAKKKSTPKWIVQHKAVRKTLGRKLVPLRTAPFLSQREREILQIIESTHPRDQTLAVDVSQSLGRNPTGINICHKLSCGFRIAFCI